MSTDTDTITELVARLAAAYADPYVLHWTPAQWAAFERDRAEMIDIGDQFPTAKMNRQVERLEAQTVDIGHVTRTLRPWTLVSFRHTGPGGDLEVLPAEMLDADTLDDQMSSAGWRYARTRGLDYRYLVRFTGSPDRWAAGWRAYVAEVQCFRVETVAQTLPASHPANRVGEDTAAIVSIPGAYVCRGWVRA